MFNHFTLTSYEELSQQDSMMNRNAHKNLFQCEYSAESELTLGWKKRPPTSGNIELFIAWMAPVRIVMFGKLQTGI